MAGLFTGHLKTMPSVLLFVESEMLENIYLWRFIFMG